MPESQLYRLTKSPLGFGFECTKIEVKQGDAYIEIARDRIFRLEKTDNHLLIYYDKESKEVINVDLAAFSDIDFYKLFGFLDYYCEKNNKEWVDGRLWM